MSTLIVALTAADHAALTGGYDFGLRLALMIIAAIFILAGAAGVYVSEEDGNTSGMIVFGLLAVVGVFAIIAASTY